MKFFSRTCITLVTTGALAVATTGTAAAMEALPAESVNAVSVELMSSAEAPAISENHLLAAFQAIEEIPDSALQSGDIATQFWLNSRLGESLPSAPGSATTFGIVGCVGAIGVATVTNLPDTYKLASL